MAEPNKTLDGADNKPETPPDKKVIPMTPPNGVNAPKTDNKQAENPKEPLSATVEPSTAPTTPPQKGADTPAQKTDKKPPTAEKPKEQSSATVEPSTAPKADNKQAAAKDAETPANNGDKLKKEQEELLKRLDEKFAEMDKKPPAAKKPKAQKDVSPAKEETPPEPPKDATRPGGAETIVYIDHAELHPFKNHPFKVRDDDEMKTLTQSVKDRGVDQPAIVRPRKSGGYELVAGHRRQHASELAGLKNLPCVVRNLSDEEATLTMAESNFNQRNTILPSERAKALEMQLNAIKRQGSRFTGIASGDVGKRSNEIVAERNRMNVKQVQRFIALNKLVPDLMKLVDDEKVKFTTAVELSYIKPKNQNYIAVAIESQSAPSLAQAQRMRELDKTDMLNGDVIDGIMLEEKKEEIKVVLNGQELSKYFGADKTPREMKDTILKLLDEYKAKQPPVLNDPEKKDR